MQVPKLSDGRSQSKAWSLAINRSCGKQSKSSDTSVRRSGQISFWSKEALPFFYYSK